ncbi:MAG: deoxyribonuclease I [Planctomycetota bacterium]
MSEQRGYPIQAGFVLLALLGGGWYFIKNYQVDGLDLVSVRSKPSTNDDEFVSIVANRSVDPAAASWESDSSRDSGSSVSRSSGPGPSTAPRPSEIVRAGSGEARSVDGRKVSQINSFRRMSPIPERGGVDAGVISRTYGSRQVPQSQARYAAEQSRQRVPFARQRYRNLKIASWAMNGFGPSKLRDNMVRKNVVRILRQFDVIALQQLQTTERDLLPRLVDAINEGQANVEGAAHYDYILGPPSDQLLSNRQTVGAASHGERLAFVFDTTMVQADRTQTYTVSDPGDQVSHDPVVAWFRAAEPDPREAWTFSLVNIRVELNRAREEVALLPSVLNSIRNDGRGEDDVVVAGLFQADDAYLLPTVAGRSMQAAVRSLPTDVYGLHQTANLLIDQAPTTEFLGRGGPINFGRIYGLTVNEAESISPSLPVYGEFSALEGGHL